MSELQSENEALLDAARRYGDVDFTSFNEGDNADPTIRKGVEIASVPAGRTLVSIKKLLDEYRLRPERKVGTSEMTTI